MRAARKPSFLIIAASLVLGACSTNPATGEQQFTALMPASQEASVGAAEHKKIEQVFGKFMTGPIHDYVNEIGQKVAKNTERPDVTYRFYVIDSPIVNAFALPGGYVYMSRGLLALANNEAEMAGVLGHEIAHITARHSAERVSQGFLAQLGAVVLSTAIDAPGVGRAASLGSDLYIKSYSRDQEHQADELGVRYLNRAGYDTFAMASFLQNMKAQDELNAKIEGRQPNQFSYFSTHPQTGHRVAEASTEASRYDANGNLGRDRYLAAINGMAYGDSVSQGLIRGQEFYHPDIGFKFGFPDGFDIQNNPTNVVGVHKGTGAIILFDAAGDKNNPDPYTFLTKIWMKGEVNNTAKALTINGMRAAQAAFPGTVNNKRVTVQATAIEWEPGKFFRFQIAIPTSLDQNSVAALSKSPKSFRRLSASEKQIKGDRIQIVTARSGDSVASIASRMPFESYNQERFRVLNGLKANEGIKAGQKYKIVVR